MIVAGPRTVELIGTDGLVAIQPVSLKGIEQEVRPFEVPWD
jgi:hypothetical protein